MSAACYLGIDPGSEGACAAVDVTGAYIDVCSLARTPAEVWGWLDTMGKARPRFALLEKVASSPQMGVKSAFTFGASYGSVRAFLVAAGVPFEEVSPGVWQRAMGIVAAPRPKGTERGSRESAAASKDRKNATKARASELFPGVRCTHGNSDALLLAELARRRSAERSR